MQRPDELYHYGIQGMRWGVRHGPPYPLYRQSSYWKRYHQRPPGGRIGGFNDSVKAAGKKWREEGIPNRIKYPVGMAAAGAVGLAAGANVAFTRNAIKNTRDMIKQTPGLGKILPKGKERIRKDFTKYLQYSDAKVKAASTLALLVGAGVATIAIKKKKEREKELAKIRKQRSKIGELRDEEAAKVQKGKIGKLTDSNPKSTTEKAKNLKSEYDAEKTALKKKLKGVGIAAGVIGAGYLAAKGGIAAGASLAAKKIKNSKNSKEENSKVKGLFNKDTPETKKAVSMEHKIEAERSSAKIVERNGVKVKVQSKKLTETENMERVNNSFRIKRTRGNSENCIACSVTMEARRRGYEVKARTDLAHDDDSETCYKSVAKVYKNAKTMSLGTNAKSGSKAYESFYNNAEAKARKGNNTDLTKKLKTTTAKMPKGASGQICIMFDRWSGHSMYFYKDRNGKTIFYDTQRNKKYTEDQLNSMFIQNSSNIVMQRFDGCDINEKELLKYSK